MELDLMTCPYCDSILKRLSARREQSFRCKDCGLDFYSGVSG